MVLDTSSIVALHLKEAGYERLIEAIEGARVILVGAPTVLESAMVLSSRMGQDARSLLFAFLRRIEAEIVPFSEEHVHAATTAFLRFGRGRHPARLNFGDCMSYAVALLAGVSLLFTGDDFKRTDIEAAC
ncbi:MAG TPA: type II toxin-antitoxin system VapC family toxin [Bryobacteraceae bacterium]|nr:type II toxin-antitoxin system VapC family toxin [Bryobacteraceae bacterium]